ncbi:unnamed protein product [Gadus morhua 'NCC']
MHQHRGDPSSRRTKRGKSWASGSSSSGTGGAEGEEPGGEGGAGRRRRSREEEEETRRELEHSRREEALELSCVKAYLRLLTDENAALQEEQGALLRRRECPERGHLTAALTQA